jgi:hypothetical protein
VRAERPRRARGSTVRALPPRPRPRCRPRPAASAAPALPSLPRPVPRRRAAIRARGGEWWERREGREERAATPPSACGEVSGGRDGARRSALMS